MRLQGVPDEAGLYSPARRNDRERAVEPSPFPAVPPPPTAPPERPLALFFRWVRRLGWKLNLLLLAATLVTTTLAGGGFLLAPDDPVRGSLSGPWLLITDPLRLLHAGLPYSLSVIAILGAHEMGHYLACRYYGVAATPPFFIPCPMMLGTFGAVIRIKETVPSRKALFDIGIAGPLAGFAVAVPIVAIGVSTAHASAPQPGGSEQVFAAPLLLDLLGAWLARPLPPGTGWELNAYLLAAWVGTFATAINLFPSGQLDGGHVCYAISRRLHRLASRATLVGLSLLLLYSISVYSSPVWLVWVVVLWVMGPRHPPLLDESEGLSPVRLVIAAVGVLVFFLSFTLVPIYST